MPLLDGLDASLQVDEAGLVSGECLQDEGMLRLLPFHTLPEYLIHLLLNPNELLVVLGLFPVLRHQFLMSPGFSLEPLSLLVQPRRRLLLLSIDERAP